MSKLESDPALLQAVTRRTFVERGLSLVDGPYCPLCDTEWDDIEGLTKHLRAKLAKSKEAEALQQGVLKNAAEVANQARRVVSLITSVASIAKADGPAGMADELGSWSDHLLGFAKSVSSVEEVIGHKASFEAGWVAPPSSLPDRLSALTANVLAKPDQSASLAAQTFLTLAQDRLQSSRAARRAEKHTLAAESRGQEVYKAYCDAMEEQLGTLYAAVEGDFSAYYRENQCR
jgi:hypothetical protein